MYVKLAVVTCRVDRSFASFKVYSNTRRAHVVCTYSAMIPAADFDTFPCLWSANFALIRLKNATRKGGLITERLVEINTKRETDVNKKRVIFKPS